jgi:hypothetical protein
MIENCPVDACEKRELISRIEALEAALREITEGSFVTDTAYDAIRIARAALAPEPTEQ